MKRQGQLFWPPNRGVSNNLKQFITDHLNFLDDEEDKVIY